MAAFDEQIVECIDMAGVNADSKPTSHFPFIVIGGGIAGVTCTETLAALSPKSQTLLLSSSPLIKAVTNFKQISKTLESFDVEERPLSDLNAACSSVDVNQAVVIDVNTTQKVVTADGNTYHYDKLCVCTGGTPKVISKDSPYVLGIRDTETVQVFQKRLVNARRIIVVGNGGIATELVYEIEGCEVIWAVKDESISSTFVDAGAATFFLPHLNAGKDRHEGPLKRRKYMNDQSGEAGAAERDEEKRPLGSALGPDWSTDLPMRGQCQHLRSVHIEYKVEVEEFLSPGHMEKLSLTPTRFPSAVEAAETEAIWPVYVKLTNGKVYGCDFVVSATGVVPNTQLTMTGSKFVLAEDGGVEVNGKMQTSIADIFAAGDVCTTTWEQAPHWLQMRLWTQARQMGAYAAKCMVADLAGQLDDISMDFCFELFAHVTKFFNFKVVLLGKFNAQDLGTDHELLLRVTKGREYVKAVMRDGRMQGAILIGETDLEETFENLILNQLDLSVYGENLLDPNVDIDDYFD